MIQVFDSWAGNLSPVDYDIFAFPYQKMVIEKVKKAHPEVPIIMYVITLTLTLTLTLILTRT